MSLRAKSNFKIINICGYVWRIDFLLLLNENKVSTVHQFRYFGTYFSKEVCQLMSMLESII